MIADLVRRYRMAVVAHGIDLNEEHVVAGAMLDQRYQGRIGAETAIPIACAVDLYRVVQCRQRRRRQDRVGGNVSGVKIRASPVPMFVAPIKTRKRRFRRSRSKSTDWSRRSRNGAGTGGWGFPNLKTA